MASYLDIWKTPLVCSAQRQSKVMRVVVAPAASARDVSREAVSCPHAIALSLKPNVAAPADGASSAQASATAARTARRRDISGLLGNRRETGPGSSRRKLPGGYRPPVEIL